MQHKREARQRGLDRHFFHLVRWELRALRGRRRTTWWIVQGLLGLGIGVAVWWAASLPETTSGSVSTARAAAIAMLLATPVRDKVADITQMTFGYGLLRFAAYTLIAFCKVVLPAVAAGSVANDRQAGRMHDLQMTPFTTTALYLAKVLAAALPFLALGTILLVVFVGVVVAEYVPISEVGRLLLETEGQIFLTACVAVTCSALFSSPWAARAFAIFLLWGALPLGWLRLLLAMGALPSVPFLGVRFAVGTEYVGFETLCWAQALLTGAACLVAIGVGVGSVQPDGFRNAVRRRWAALGHQAKGERNARHAGRPGV